MPDLQNTRWITILRAVGLGDRITRILVSSNETCGGGGGGKMKEKLMLGFLSFPKKRTQEKSESEGLLLNAFTHIIVRDRVSAKRGEEGRYPKLSKALQNQTCIFCINSKWEHTTAKNRKNLSRSVIWMSGTKISTCVVSLPTTWITP